MAFLVLTTLIKHILCDLVSLKIFERRRAKVCDHLCYVVRCRRFAIFILSIEKMAVLKKIPNLAESLVTNQ